ncbi:amino-acid permease BAT1 homolog isoform X2 [Typha angustifolia]|uniref:amino-acid permease BAT1 homolog isoform X2 n=1 Tax=Typha angustifolia TaxID=59011 RepID=UPI003C2BB0C6
MFILKGKLESGSHAIGQTLLCPEIPPKRTFPFISTILGSQKLFQCLFSPRTFSSFCKPLVDLEMGMGEARDGASYVRLQDEIEDSDADDSKLKQLGYKPELSRSLSAISNFAVTFSIISVLTGITTLFGTGLEFGGPVTMIYGWPIAGAFTIVVGLSMAEICSAYPTSGGLYFWSAKLCGEQWGPFASWITGWFNIVGQWAVTTSVDFSLAQLIQVIILLSTGGNNGGGYKASKYVVIGFHGGILLLHAIINSLSITWLSFFGQLAAAWNVLGVFVLMITIPVVSTKRASAEFVFTHFNTDNGAGIHSKLYIFVVGLLMSQYTLTGYDASAHMTEETKSADKNGPRGIISAIGISIIVGWGYLLGITFAVTNVPYLLSTNNDAGGYAIAEVFYLAFKNRYGNGVGGIICLGIVAVAIFFCGMSSVTSNSRMAYAFSRDGAMPLSSLWHKVNKQEVPINAVWLSAFISFCMALTSLGSLVAFQAMVSIATIGLYIAYALPIFFRVTLARKSFVPGPYNLGRYGVLVGWVAVLWVATITVLFSLPVAYPITKDTLNYTPVAVGGLFILVVSSWILSARHWFRGPITNIDT